MLLICGGARRDSSCPGEISKAWRLTELARRVVPCSCYRHHALNQADDWAAKRYERWVAAQAVIIFR